MRVCSIVEFSLVRLSMEENGTSRLHILRANGELFSAAGFNHLFDKSTPHHHTTVYRLQSQCTYTIIRYIYNNVI